MAEFWSTFLAMFKSSIFALIFILIHSCSFTGNRELRKSKSYVLNFESKAWSSIDPKGADYAYLSHQTKSILVINSLCGLYKATSLGHLTSNMMGGIESIDIQQEEERKLVRRKSLRTYAAGEIDGVPISLLIETVRKDNCIYDFALISSSQKLRSKDEDSFNQMLASFNIP